MAHFESCGVGQSENLTHALPGEGGGASLTLRTPPLPKARQVEGLFESLGSKLIFRLDPTRYDLLGGRR